LTATDHAKLELTSRDFSIGYVCHHCAKFKGTKGETDVKVEKQREVVLILGHNFEFSDEMLSAARTRLGTRVSTFGVEQQPFQRMLFAFARPPIAHLTSRPSKLAQTRLQHTRVSFSSQSDSRKPWRVREEKVSGSDSKRSAKKQTAAFKPNPAKPSHLASRPIFLKPVEARPSRTPAWRRPPDTPPTPEFAKKHRETMKKRFPEGWKPSRTVSREAMEGIRALHVHDPERYTTPLLAEKFKISPEAVRRILKSKWKPTPEREAKMIEKGRRARQEAIMRSNQEEVMQLIRAGITIKSDDGLELVHVEKYAGERLEKIQQRRTANDVLSTLKLKGNQ
jgi:hypothetical protein